MALIHKRFDESEPSSASASAVPIPPSSLPSSRTPSPSPSPSSDPESSDDEAPEAISTHTAATRSLSAQRKIADSISHAASEAKTRRRAREEKIAAQSKSKSKNQNKSRVTPVATTHGLSSDSESDSDSEEEEEEQNEDNPPLLPPSVLAAAEAAERQAEEAAFRAGVPQNLRKRKFLDVGEKKVRDVRVGRTAVRVLEKAPEGLAPKAVGQSRRTREAWLAGRRGQKGVGKGTSHGIGGRKTGPRGFVVK